MQRQRRHKKLTDWGRQLLLQVARWLPDRQIIGVGDSSYAATSLLNAVRSRVCMITRLRLDARLFDPPARRRPGTVGRPRVVGTRQANLAGRLTNPKTRWRRVKVTGWYGRGERTVEIMSGTALWHHPGRLVPIRYVLVRDVAGELRWRFSRTGPAATIRAQSARVLANRAHQSHLSSRCQAPSPDSSGPSAAGVPVHRPQSRSSRHPALVRPSLVYRGHLCRGSPSPRGRDPTPVVRSSHRTHDTRPARPVLSRHAVGAQALRQPANDATGGGLVSEAAADLQRCTRPRSPRTLDPTGF